MRGDLKMS